MKYEIESNFHVIVDKHKELEERELKNMEGILNQELKKLVDDFIKSELKGEGGVVSSIVTIKPYEKGTDLEFKG